MDGDAVLVFVVLGGVIAYMAYKNSQTSAYWQNYVQGANATAQYWQNYVQGLGNPNA